MVALMEGHYNSAIGGHDALIRGDLETLRARLAEIHERSLPPAAPASWRTHEARLHTASRGAATASDLESAALAMAAVAEACGSCHTAVGLEEIYRRPAAPQGDSPVETAMLGHQWATERLWEGVTGPWDDAWVRGADALAQSRVFTEEGTPPSSSLQAREAEMRRLGEEAKLATQLSTRSEVYGRLLATCGACHTEAGVAFDAN
jgi:cytochrome c553